MSSETVPFYSEPYGFTWGAMTIHLDEGTTPMFLACRAEGVEPDQATCKGQAVSLGYPSNELPEYLKDQLLKNGWEWRKPRMGEFLSLDEATVEHVQKGGLLLHRLSGDGRDMISAER